MASNVRLAGRRFPRARPRCFEKCLILPHSFTGHVALRHGDKFIRSALKFAIGAPLCRFRLFLAARGPQGAQTIARGRMADVCSHGVDTGFVDLGYAKVAVLGVVQGVTELLPISSTAHNRSSLIRAAIPCAGPICGEQNLT